MLDNHTKIRDVRIRDLQSGAFIEFIISEKMEHLRSKKGYCSDIYIISHERQKVNNDNYNAEMFFKSLKSYIRIHLKHVSLEMLLGDALNYFEEINAIIDRYCSLSLPNIGKEEQIIRIFTKNIEHSIVYKAKEIKRVVNQADSDYNELQKSSDYYIFSCQKIIAQFNLWRSTVKEYKDMEEEEKKHRNMYRVLELCESYICYMIIKTNSSIINMIIKHKGYSSDLKKIKYQFVSLSEEIEINLRENLNAPTLRFNTPNRKYITYVKLLKRYVNSVLFIEARSRKDMLLAQEFIMSIAAALSMVIATLIAYRWQYKYGSISYPLFVALVLSYILKDRIKEYTRTIGIKWLHSKFWNYKRDLIRGLKRKIGYYTEAFTNTTNFDALPEDVKKIHQLGNNPEDAPSRFNLFNIINYSQVFRFNKRKHRFFKHSYNGEEIFFISRISLLPFFNNNEKSTTKWYKYDRETDQNILLETIKTYNLTVIQKRYFKGEEKNAKLIKHTIRISPDGSIHSITKYE